VPEGKHNPVALHWIPSRNIVLMHVESEQQSVDLVWAQKKPSLPVLRQHPVWADAKGRNNSENVKRIMISALFLCIIYTNFLFINGIYKL